VVPDYDNLPLHFEANVGQTRDGTDFLARGHGYSLFLTASESVLVLGEPDVPAPPQQGLDHRPSTSSSEAPAVVRMKLLGANARPVSRGRDPLPGKSNYFIGKDPKKWRTNVPTYGRVEYEGVYPGVSLAYYGNQRQLEYDFVVGAGADPSRIRIGIEGADAVRVDEKGNLALGVAQREIVERAPVVYQEIEGERKTVGGRFVLHGPREVGFEVDTYDREHALVLDPLLAYSSPLGGSIDDGAGAVAVDAAGNVYVAGSAALDFPIVGGLPPPDHRGGYEAFIVKLNPAGTAILYSTFLGGSSTDAAEGIAVDDAGNAYVTGSTNSVGQQDDFPTVGAVQPIFGGGHPYDGFAFPSDAFVAKLSPSGSALVYSTYLGGSGNDAGYGIAVDASGNAYVTGDTRSTNFPTANAVQPLLGGGSCFPSVCADAFVAKLNAAGSALVYSTYLGGNAPDSGRGIAVDASENAYVAGGTGSANFPVANALQPARLGSGDGFIAKLDAAGAFVYSTYLGGTGGDSALGVAVDPSGNVTVVGGTGSPDFPTANAFQATLRGPSDAFVARLNAAGSGLVYSSYLGGSGVDAPGRIAVDAQGNAYVVGSTYSTDFPVLNPIQAANGDGVYGRPDAFVAKIDATGDLTFSTYFGGPTDDFGYGLAADGAENVYFVGRGYLTPILNPVRPYGGQYDGYVAKIAVGHPPPPPVGDFNSDGSPDILWHNPTTGDSSIWYMNGTAFAASVVPTRAPLDWQIAGSARFDADGWADVLWRNRATGENVIWRMNNGALNAVVYLPAISDLSWQIGATGDFDGDGKADILWRNQATGHDVVWFMKDMSIKGGAVLTAVLDTTWRIVGAGDFDGDGKPDILWRNQSSGDNLVWFMNGTNIKGGSVLTPISDVDWTVGAVADYNGDLKPDIVWHHGPTGDTVVWLMDGTAISSGVVLARVDPQWTVVGPR
jgi:hypothetical protein